MTSVNSSTTIYHSRRERWPLCGHSRVLMNLFGYSSMCFWQFCFAVLSFFFLKFFLRGICANGIQAITSIEFPLRFLSWIYHALDLVLLYLCVILIMNFGCTVNIVYSLAELFLGSFLIFWSLYCVLCISLSPEYLSILMVFLICLESLFSFLFLQGILW